MCSTMLKELQVCGLTRWHTSADDGSSTFWQQPHQLAATPKESHPEYMHFWKTILFFNFYHFLFKMLKANMLKSANVYPWTFQILLHEKPRGESRGQHDSVLFETHPSLMHVKMGYLRGGIGRNCSSAHMKDKEVKGRIWRDASLAGCALLFCFICPTGILQWQSHSFCSSLSYWGWLTLTCPLFHLCDSLNFFRIRYYGTELL